MKPCQWIGLAIFSGLVYSPILALTMGKISDRAENVALDKLEVGDLIDKLQEESEAGIGFHPTAWASGFIAIDEEAQFRGGMAGSEKPTTHPILRELVRRGVISLPKLLEHIRDKRPTKLTIKHNFNVGGVFSIGGMWHSDEYDPRYADPKRWPDNINTDLQNREGFQKGEDFETSYTIRVGDLCFVAIGQIVNSDFQVVRYQPTACIIINSPVQTPALAEAVRRDWSGLTENQHKQHLIETVYNNYPSASCALKRLLFYYSKDGERVVLKLLSRNLYSNDALQEFVSKKLIKEKDPTKWKTLIREFCLEYSDPAAAFIPLKLRCALELRSKETKIESLEERDRAKRILAVMFQGHDLNHTHFMDGAEPREQRVVVETVNRIHSDDIDKAVYRIFLVATKMKPSTEKEQIQLDELAMACITRLVGHEHDAEFRVFVCDRIKSIETLHQEDYGRQSMHLLLQLQKSLGK